MGMRVETPRRPYFPRRERPLSRKQWPGRFSRRAVTGFAAFGALAGAGVGYWLGHGKLELVYQAPKKKR